MIRILISLCAVMILAASAQAQRPGDRGGQPGGLPGGFGGPPGFPLMIALDADRDGKLSAWEIDNAAELTGVTVPV